MEYVEIDKAKEAILSIMLKEPVKETEDVISAYTLISAIREQKRRLSCIGEVEKGLLDKLNDIYPKEVTKGKRKLFKKTPVTVKNYFDTISHGFTCDDIVDNTPGNSNLSLKVRDGNYAITILKDFGMDDAYSLEDTVPLDEEAYEQCEDDIQKVLSTVEYYGKLFNLDVQGDDKKTSISDRFSYEGFDISISFDSTSCRFDYSYGLNQEIDPYASSYRRCYGFGADNTLRNTILENEETILKNIPINMNNDLSCMFFMIVDDYRKTVLAEEKAREQEKLMQKTYNKLKINGD